MTPPPLQMRVLISDTHQYVYHMNPKVGSNTTLAVLYLLAGLDEEAMRNPHRTSRRADQLAAHGLRAIDLNTANCSDFLKAVQNYYSFSFTRNPFTRLKSAYKDKLKRFAEVRLPELVASIARRAGSGNSKKIFQYELMKEIPFSRFVEDICTTDLYIDQHWVPQYDRLRPDLCRFDFLGKLENYRADMGTVLEAIGESTKSDLIPAKSLNATPNNDTLADYYDERLVRLVQKAYQRDFSQFAYSHELSV